MDIEEFKAAKREAERKVLELLQDFSCRTGASVTKINISIYRPTIGHEQKLWDVHFDVGFF